MYSKEENRRRSEINYPIGSVFIGIANEWTPMSIVSIDSHMSIGSSCVPVGKDLFSGKKLVMLSKLMNYSDDMVKILKKLDPNERYAICANYPSIIGTPKTDSNNIEPFENEPSTEEIIKKVKNHGY